MSTGFQSVCKSTECKKKDMCGRYSTTKSDYQIFRDFLSSNNWTLEECYVPNGKRVNKNKKRKGK